MLVTHIDSISILNNEVVRDWARVLIGLVNPIATVGVAIFINRALAFRNEKNQKAQRDEEQKREERLAAIGQRKDEDRARQESLKQYIQILSNLLTDKQLVSKPHNSPEVKAARAITVMAFQELDQYRIRVIARFLADSELINGDPEDSPVLFYQSYLSGLDLSGVPLPCSNIDNSKLNNVNLEGSILEGATLQSSDLSYSNLKKANLFKSNLTEARLFKADLSEAFLTKAILQNVSMGGAILENANLQKANLDQSFCRLADFSNAILQGASFQRANLMSSKFTGAELLYADFRCADLRDADLSEARLESLPRNDLSAPSELQTYMSFVATLDGEYKGPSFVKFQGAKYNTKTRFPEDFDQDAEGMIFSSEE